MELDLLPRYEYEIDAEGTSYTFVTDYKLSYKVTFFPLTAALQDYPDIVDVLFEFGFERLDIQKRTPRDSKIKATILHILYAFFSSLPYSAIYYVCDSADKSHVGRKRLFDKWFFEYGEKGENLYAKYDYEPEAEDMELLISFIAKRTNPNLEKMLQSFEQVLEDYSVEK